MGLFGKKKKAPVYVQILAGSLVIYKGRWDEFPIDEAVMLEKSREFYNDPEPCSIHRGGVRQSLLDELNALFDFGEDPESREGIQKLGQYMDCEEVTEVLFSDTP